MTGSVVDLAHELDSKEAEDGTSLLDHTLIVWLEDYGSTVRIFSISSVRVDAMRRVDSSSRWMAESSRGFFMPQPVGHVGVHVEDVVGGVRVEEPHLAHELAVGQVAHRQYELCEEGDSPSL